MDIPVAIEHLELDSDNADHASGIIAFNGRTFRVSVTHHAGTPEGPPTIAIAGIDPEALAKAGFVLDLAPLRAEFLALREEFLANQRQMERRFREKTYQASRLHELTPILGQGFALIGLDQYLNSRSGALYGKYTELYREHAKELSVFMSHDQFVVFDYLNERQIPGHAETPEETAEVIAEHLREWRHRVDYVLALQAHAPEDHPVPAEGMLHADDYVRMALRQDAATAAEIRRNHENYLREMGRLGRPDEVADHARRHHDRTDTRTLETKRILGGLSTDHLTRIRNLFREGQTRLARRGGRQQ
jgi:hypothetical protein